MVVQQNVPDYVSLFYGDVDRPLKCEERPDISEEMACPSWRENPRLKSGLNTAQEFRGKWRAEEFSWVMAVSHGWPSVTDL